MPLTYFLRIPGISGESTTATHVGDIPIIAADYGFGTQVAANGLPLGKPRPRVLNVSHRLDNSSSSLGSVAVKRSVLSSVRVFGYANGVGDILTLTLTDALIESIDYHDLVGGSTRIYELYTFSYRQIQLAYQKLSADGRLVAGGGYTYTPVV